MTFSPPPDLPAGPTPGVSLDLGFFGSVVWTWSPGAAGWWFYGMSDLLFDVLTPLKLDEGVSEARVRENVAFFRVFCSTLPLIRPERCIQPPLALPLPLGD